MTAVSVTTSATQIVAPSSATKLILVVNNSAQVVYVSFDGTTADVANGTPLAINEKMWLNGQNACSKGIFGIVAATTADVRVQVC